MFWQAYEVEYLTDDPKIMDNIHTIDFWEGIAFFDIRMKRYTPYAITARTAFDEQGRLVVRGEFD